MESELAQEMLSFIEEQLADYLDQEIDLKSELKTAETVGKEKEIRMLLSSVQGSIKALQSLQNFIYGKE